MQQGSSNEWCLPRIATVSVLVSFTTQRLALQGHFEAAQQLQKKQKYVDWKVFSLDTL